MTVLRFGTDTGHVTPREESKLTSVGGGFSQRVTPDGTLRGLALARAASGRQSRVRPRLLEGLRGSEEVANSKGVGAGLRSGSQAQSNRYPGVPRSHGAKRLRMRRPAVEQAHEGRAQAQRLSWQTSEGEKVKRASARPRA
jgi:hypothetical protein